MQRRTNISTKFDIQDNNPEGTTFCYHCSKKFKDGEDIIIHRDHVIEKWDALESAGHAIPIRHPRYHVGCYFLLKSQSKLPKNNVAEMKNYADYHNYYARKGLESTLQNTYDAVMPNPPGKMQRRKK